MAAFCDYDRDGWLDVYVQTNLLDAAAHPNGQRDYLFHNNRDGTFTNVTDRAGIGGEAQGHSATWWDYDNDGWPDLYVANDFGAPDKLYHNNRDGTFTERRRSGRAAHAVFLDGLGPGRREQRRPDRSVRRRHGGDHPREGPARHGRFARPREGTRRTIPTLRRNTSATRFF